jgi:hypothetical protein
MFRVFASGMAANLQLLGSTLLATKGGPSAITPISYARTLTQKFGSEDLIDSAELAQRGPRMFRDWSELDSLYKKRQLTALSKMITAAALNEVNGALALFVRCSTLLYSYERNWLEFYQDVVLTAWPEHSPTSIPQGISFMGFTKEGRSTAYAASVEMPNAVLCDPNFGDTRLRHMLQGVNKTAAYTMQRNFATALCARPFYDFCDKHITAGGVSFEQVYNHMSQYFCTAAVNVAAMQLVLDEAIDKYPPKDTIVVPQVRSLRTSCAHEVGARVGVRQDPRRGESALPGARARHDGRRARPPRAGLHQARVQARGHVRQEHGPAGQRGHCQVPDVCRARLCQ